MKEPTGEQCNNNDKVFDENGKIGYAVWYPQMGGYAGKAVAIFDKEWGESSDGRGFCGCIDMLVWHDGQFPFKGENPCEIHHCDPQQFIDFGETLHKLREPFRVEYPGE